MYARLVKLRGVCHTVDAIGSYFAAFVRKGIEIVVLVIVYELKRAYGIRVSAMTEGALLFGGVAEVFKRKLVVIADGCVNNVDGIKDCFVHCFYAVVHKNAPTKLFRVVNAREPFKLFS